MKTQFIAGTAVIAALLITSPAFAKGAGVRLGGSINGPTAETTNSPVVERLAIVAAPGAKAEETPAISRANAIGSAQRAKIARLRALAGSAQYRPTINCESDIVNNAEWSNNTTILAGGFCPSYMRRRTNR